MSTRDPNANFIELRCYTVEVQSQLRTACVTRCRLLGDGSFYVRFRPAGGPPEDNPTVKRVLRGVLRASGRTRAPPERNDKCFVTPIPPRPLPPPPAMRIPHVC